MSCQKPTKACLSRTLNPVNLDSMRLLIVEDDERTASYLVRGLSESGHVVDRASDGEMGLALALEGIYDALVIDRRLPELDGIALVKRLRERNALIPVLMLSAIAS